MSRPSSTKNNFQKTKNMQKIFSTKQAYEAPIQEIIDIRLNGAIAVTSPTEPIIEDPEEEI